MLLIPRATEKAYAEQSRRTYIFETPLDASKQSIATAVSQQYQVTVTDVRTQVRKGKPTRFSRGKRVYPGTTHRRDRKYAYITVKEGDSIKIFEDASAEATTETKTEEPKEKRTGLLGRRSRSEKDDKTAQSEGEKA